MDTYKGRPIDDMTRDELVPALKDVMRKYLAALDEQVMLFNAVARRESVGDWFKRVARKALASR